MGFVFAVCLFVAIKISLDVQLADEVISLDEMLDRLEILLDTAETLQQNRMLLPGLITDEEWRDLLEEKATLDKWACQYVFIPIWEFVVLNMLYQGLRSNSWKMMTFVLVSPYIRRKREELQLSPIRCSLSSLEYYKCYHRVDAGQLAFFFNYQFETPQIVTDILSIVLHVVILTWWFRFIMDKMRPSSTTTEPPPRKMKPRRRRFQGQRQKENRNGSDQVQNTRPALEFKVPTEPKAKPVNARLQRDQDCFFHACLYGHKETVQAILSNPSTAIEIAEVEPITGQTAFHLACIRGQISIVKYLLKTFKPEVCNNLKNTDGLTGLEVATELGRAEVVRALLKAMPQKQIRRDKWIQILKSALKISVEKDSYKIAKDIYNQLGNTEFSTKEPHFSGYFQSYQDTCTYLANLSQPHTIQGQMDRETKLKTRDAYRNYICAVLSGTGASRALNSTRSALDDEDLDCPVCFDFMCQPRKIFSCYNGHLLCSTCRASPTIQCCPICRDDFKARKPRRSLDAEDKARQIVLRNRI